MGYPRERKEAVLKKMLPPNNQTISEISKEEGICERSGPQKLDSTISASSGQATILAADS